MTRTLSLFALLLFVAPLAFAQNADELHAIERTWLDAYENNDREAMEQIVADGFLITYSDGQTRDKAQTIAALDPNGGNNPNTRMYTENAEVRFFGSDVAVIRGLYVYEAQNQGGNPPTRSESLYTDTYMRIDGRWQVIASHLSDPPDSN